MMKSEKTAKSEINVDLTEDEMKILTKIANGDSKTPEELLKKYLDNLIHTYGENLISCEDCGKKIKEREQYFVKESSFSIYDKENDRIVETKLNSWSDFVICMPCHLKRESKKEALSINIVKDHDSERPVIKIKEENQKA
ncbi:MAG: hypothetical protein Q7R70_02785 [Candidatus Diapherotrites archaeon]|nr:hypothetical protein [Candidatus Diapherotrites archaeon]